MNDQGPERQFPTFEQLMIEKQDLKLRLFLVMAAVSLLTFGTLVEAYKLLA